MKTIPLSQGKVAIVDDEHYEELSQYDWHYCKSGYAARALPRSVGHGHQYMHRFLLQADKGQEVDHINGNKLDNRRENLRLCNTSQNHCNHPRPEGVYTSRFRGVYRKKNSGWWCAQVSVHHRTIFLGHYPEEQMAAMAHDAAATHYFGAFAQLNLPDRLCAFETIVAQRIRHAYDHGSIQLP